MMTYRLKSVPLHANKEETKKKARTNKSLIA